MRKINVFHVDAFTNVPFGGNPAGVIPFAEGLSEKEMQQIANELNLSESSFLLPSTNPDADFKIRYFTRTEEIDFCGHATVGMAWVLATTYEWQYKASEVVFETNAGLVPVKWMKEREKLTAVSMTQLAPQVKDINEDKNVIASLVGIEVEDIDERYPIKIGYTGVWHLLVPVNTRRAIDLAEPKLHDLRKMNQKYNISTNHLFTFDTDQEFDMYTRDFCPNIGIDEDPVTGAANGALAGYLYLEKIIANKEVHQFNIGQGHAMNRPGTLFVTVTPGHDHPVIEVAGQAVTSIEGNVLLP